jgi:hypothetical protein
LAEARAEGHTAFGKKFSGLVDTHGDREDAAKAAVAETTCNYSGPGIA